MDGIHFVQILVRFLLLHKGAVPHMDDKVIATAFRACATNRLQPRPGSRLPPWMVVPFVLFAQAAAAGVPYGPMRCPCVLAKSFWPHMPAPFTVLGWYHINPGVCSFLHRRWRLHRHTWRWSN